jgi:hypothetical protein
MSLPQHSMKHLEHLDIRIYGNTTVAQSTTSCLETLPSLRRVSFTSVNHRRVTLSLLLPWEQLIEIVVTYIDMSPTVTHTILRVSLSNVTLPYLEILDLISYYLMDLMDWMYPDGLEVFCNFADAVIQDSTSGAECRDIRMAVACSHGRGYAQIEKCYRQSYERYRRCDWLDWEIGCGMAIVCDSGYASGMGVRRN